MEVYICIMKRLIRVRCTARVLAALRSHRHRDKQETRGLGALSVKKFGATYGFDSILSAVCLESSRRPCDICI